MVSEVAYRMGQVGLKTKSAIPEPLLNDNRPSVNFGVSSVCAVALCSTAAMASHNFVIED